MSACALSSSFCVMAALQQAADWNLLFCEMRWFEERPPQASRGLFLLSVLSCALLSECTAYCTQTLKSLCSLSPPCLYLSLSLSLFSFPLFSPLWVAFDAFAFYECFSLTPASPCLSFLSVKQWVFFLSNNVDKLHLVKCHFPCLLPFWASFPPWSP